MWAIIMFIFVAKGDGLEEAMRKLKAPLQEKTVIIPWILSFLFILILPIVIASFLLSTYSQRLRSAIIQNNQAILLNNAKYIDERFLAANKLSYQLSLNPRVRRHASISNLILDRNRMNLYELTKDFASYQGASPNGQNSYLYFDEIDSVVGPNYHSNNEMFYGLHIDPDSISFDEWSRFLKDESHYNFISIKSTKGEEFLLYTQDIKLNNTTSKVRLLSFISSHSLFHSLEQNAQVDHYYWMIASVPTDRDKDFFGDILLSNLPESELTQEDYAQLIKENTSDLQIQDEQMMMKSVESEVVPLTYISFVPTDTYWNLIKDLKVLIIVSSILTFGFGTVLIIFFIRKQYQPLQNLLNLIHSRQEIESGKQGNEYQRISDSIENLLAVQLTTENRIEEQNLRLRESLFNRLLHGNVTETWLEQINLASLGVAFEQPFFTLIVLYFEKNNGDQDLADFIVTNIFEELMAPKSEIYHFTNQHLLTFIVNHPTNSHDWLDFVDKNLERTIQITEKNFALRFRVAVSRPMNKLLDLDIAYAEATALLTNKILQNEDADIFYVSHAGPEEYVGESDTISEIYRNKLANALQVGKKDDSVQVILDIFKHYKNFSLHYKNWQYINFQILNVLLDLMTSDCRQECLRKDPYLNLEKKLLRGEDPLPFFAELIADFFPDEESINEIKNDSLADAIRSYVELNYRNPDLNVNYIGRHFALTPTYLAKLFKEQTGVALLDFLNQVRINSSKIELIQNPDLSILEIAEQNGFTNQNTYIRLFKKFEGITPGKFRDSHL